MNRYVIRRRLASPLLTVLLLVVAACGGETEPAADETMQDTTEMAPETPTSTIIDVARADTSFSTLVAVLEQTGLDETLNSEGPFTVFAPTNAAFARLSDGTLDTLTNEELTNLLTYHIVSGRMPAADVSSMAALPTTQGSDLTVTVTEDGTVMVNDATVVMTDVEAENGIIHVLDTVLMPPAETDM